MDETEHVTSDRNLQIDVPPKKRRCESHEDAVATFSDRARRMRLLSRRYNLTRTGYKYLEIGRGIPTTKDRANVDIALGDANCKEILLTPAMWKQLVDNKTVISDYLARTTDDHVTPAPVRLDDLTIRFATINSHPTIRLDTASGRMTISGPTARYLFGLQHCVDRIIRTMGNVVERAETKLRCFRGIATEVQDPSCVAGTIRASAAFDRNDVLDCELHAIVYLAM